MTSADVVVVGGGPTGLTAALGAARRGLAVRLVDAAPGFGGMSASTTVGGQRVDLGSHRLHPSMSAPVRALLTELLGDDLQTRARNGRLLLRGRWVRFPFRAVDLARSLPPAFTVASVRDAATARWRRPTADSYAEVVRVGLGPTALVDFHGPMAAKLWGRPADRLAGELARRRVSVRTPGALARTVARTSRPDGRTFLYPRLGYGQIVDRLVDAATVAGAELSHSATIASLCPPATPADPVRVVLGDGAEIEAGRVLWSAAPEALVAAAGSAVPDGDRSELRSMVLVYLVVPMGRFTEFDAHYVPDPGVCFSRLSEPRNYRDGPDPEGTTVLCAEIPCSEGDDTWTASDADLAERVLDGLVRCGLGRPPVAAVETRRLPRVYPVIDVDDPDRRRRVLARADAVPGVTVLGRQGLVVADNLHHVIDMALAAVECLGSGWNNDRWARHRERFDGFVVQD